MPLLRSPFLHRSVRGGAGGRIQFVGGAPGRPGSSTPTRRTGGSALLLSVVLAAGIGLGILHNKWRAQHRNDIVLSGVRTLTYPFQRGDAVAEAGVFRGWDIVFRGQALEAENERLKQTVDSLRAENESLKVKAAEADRYLPALGLMRVPAPTPLTAPVIALLPTPHFDSITVARGTRDGIHLQSIARTPSGLVGQVTDTSSLVSEVMLLSDTNSEVGALVRRKGVSLGIIGIVQGQGRGRALKIKDLKNTDDIRVGDEIVSSGYGGVFPKDVPIGTVISIKSDEDALFLKSAVVAPAAGMPGDLREVYLLRP